MMMNNMIGFVTIGMFVWMSLCWAVLLGGIYLIIRLFRSGVRVKQDEAILTIRARYARGEITEEEYFKISESIS
jgi:uncharacterized membrane protein